ncbi:MAG: hypothetical protein QOG84_928 [Sphingomonadales bacterium]|nr:hypothetical protein [Sphingomonadales bacterium]
MSAEELLNLLSQFEALVGERRRGALFNPGEIHFTATNFTFSVRRNDWRPVWDKAREVQGAFNAKPQFPTVTERQEAWTRFNALRDEASQIAKEERSDFETMSSSHRDDLMGDLRYLECDGTEISLADAVFGSMDAEGMKQLGAKLGVVSRRFSEVKHRMTREHKQEVFDRIQEVRASHDRFWGRRKQAMERARAERDERRAQFVDRVRANIRGNYERLAKAEAAEERVRSNLRSNYEKLSDARSESFAERVRSWISEDEDRLEDIRRSIDRIRS